MGPLPKVMKKKRVPLFWPSFHGIENVMEIKSYSTLRRLYRVTDLVERFCFNIFQRVKNDRRKSKSILEEIVASEGKWVKVAQRKLK